MTAEIAVMNKSAIALAADSKVTVTGGGTSKTYDTVNKLFTLSKIAPVGIMVYGNAEFMGYPWETIIKIYREKVGRTTFPTVEIWTERFFRFLDGFGNITSDDREENVRGICRASIYHELSQYHEAALSQGVSPDTPEYDAGLNAHLIRKMKAIVKKDNWGTKAQQIALIKVSGNHIVDAVQRYLSGYSDDVKKTGVMFLSGVLIFRHASPQMSGVVIAGFGDDEYFPTLIEHEVDGYVGRRIKRYRVAPDVDLSRQNRGCIRPFAQKEMVQRFMNGIDPFFGAYLMNYCSKLIIENCSFVLDQYGQKRYKTAKVRDAINEAVGKAFADFSQKAKEYREERFSDPVMGMVALLPKDELAHLAESLVALTSLKRRVSSDAETVGGPIDVALISKGDGFVWVKRKHYFPAELNPQFPRVYMDRMGYGEKDGARRSARGSSGASAARSSRGRGSKGGA